MTTTTRIVLDPACPIVMGAELYKTDDVTWREHHRLTCQRCSDYAARDAELKAQAIATFQPDDLPDGMDDPAYEALCQEQAKLYEGCKKLGFIEDPITEHYGVSGMVDMVHCDCEGCQRERSEV